MIPLGDHGTDATISYVTYDGVRHTARVRSISISHNRDTGGTAMRSFGGDIGVFSVTGTIEAHFDSPKLYERFMQEQDRLQTMIKQLVCEFKKTDGRRANDPWYGDFATRPLANEAIITQNANKTPIRMRSKTATLDRTRYKRRRFLQQLRTT